MWFCAHPDDYQAFLGPIADEILKKQNCAVYFDAEPAESFETEMFFADLSRMVDMCFCLTEVEKHLRSGVNTCPQKLNNCSIAEKL